MRNARFWPPSLIALACLLVITAGCGGDGGDSPDIILPPLQEEVAAGFLAVAVATDDFLTEHRELLASLEVFGARVGASLETPVETMTRGLAGGVAAACIPADVQNKVFKYDTLLSEYVSTSDPGAPAGGVRYLLYTVDASGVPITPLENIGWLDIVCEGLLPAVDSLAIAVVDSTRDITVIDIVLAGSVNPPAFDFTSGSGLFRDKQGDELMMIEVAASGTAGVSLNDRLAVTGGLEAIDSRLDLFEAAISREDPTVGTSGLPEPPLDTLHTSAVMETAGGATKFTAGLMMSVDGNGRIVNILGGDTAPLEYDDHVGSGSGILACYSLAYDFPLVESANTSGGCATGSINTPLSQPGRNLDAYSEGHLALLDLLKTVAPLYGITVRVLTTP